MSGEEITYLDIEEFRDAGYLHEVNRLVLHPAGLALEVSTPWTAADLVDFLDAADVHIDSETAEALVAALKFDRWTLSGVWDYRDDAEGIVFGDVDPGKIEAVRAEWRKHYAARARLLGVDEAALAELLPGARIQQPGETGEQS